MDPLTPLSVSAVTEGGLIVAGVIAIVFLAGVAKMLVTRIRESAELGETTPGLTAEPPSVTGTLRPSEDDARARRRRVREPSPRARPTA